MRFNPHFGSEISHGELPPPSDSEIKKLNEEELKAAIKSTWKKFDRLAKKEMGALLYLLRAKLNEQSSRSDLNDGDKDFGAWVEKTIEVSCRTSGQWANEYGFANRQGTPE